MKIVIDIEDYDREWIANGYHIPDEINSKIADAIISSTPLPEYHGRLIDADKLLRVTLYNPLHVPYIKKNDIIDAPTIIERSDSE